MEAVAVEADPTEEGEEDGGEERFQKLAPRRGHVGERTMMQTQQPLYANPQTANDVADQVIALITEIHATAYQPLLVAREDARRRFCEYELSMISAAMLTIGCGLSTLAQYAARLQEAAENKKYAPTFWSTRVLN